ncbi:MAG: VOC family protein [Bacteroidota bacterium]
MSKKVTGIGGIFFKADDPDGMKAWYNKHLGIPSDRYGALFSWHPKGQPDHLAFTNWSIMSKDTDHTEPSKSSFMINYRVENLEELLIELEKEGVEIIGQPQSYEYGKFAWIMDPEGNKIELWEPIDKPFEGGNNEV